MNNKIFSRLVFCSALIILGCSKDNTTSSSLTQSKEGVSLQNAQEFSLTNARGAIQLSGIGFYAAAGECEPLIAGAAYAIKLTGDFEGCLYAFIDDFECSPSGTYREEGREYFVGTYKGQAGTFWTTYKFEGKYAECAANGAALGPEIFGRCQHPIVTGTGTDALEGIKGRILFKDDIEAGNFPYRGQVQF